MVVLAGMVARVAVDGVGLLFDTRTSQPPMFTGSVPAWFWGFFARTPHGGWMCPWLSLIDVGNDVRGISPAYLWGLNFSIRRSVVVACGGFNPDLVPARRQR